ncbi:MAG: ADP-ribosylglycohydrolase family protein [Propionibacteriaceae bacterium]|jgi:ADP-ribosylglycohydrolase|nr:ADP-ribosylglycohydrolase family protein [Propionibacteriaceae bacterium]
MELSAGARDRAAGVLLGQAIGDALGVPYEFAAPVKAGEARMIGGGLGPYAPGEWSDDTQMALCIAQVAAAGADLTTDDALDAVAEAFIGWKGHGASDIGRQTATVLARASARDAGTRLSHRMTAVSMELAQDGRAGNGGLMRTAIVGLSALDSAEQTALAAARVSALTHAEARCVDSCVLWSLAVRNAVLTAALDLRGGLAYLPAERRGRWEEWIAEAETKDPSTFTPNGYTVTALQAAWSAIVATQTVAGPDHVSAALHLAISIGDDTDTVAAIAGGLLGARWGAERLPREWVDQVHGWPGLNAADLTRLGLAVAGTPLA